MSNRVASVSVLGALVNMKKRVEANTRSKHGGIVLVAEPTTIEFHIVP